jgi:rod shape-determining protein MreB
VEVSYREIAKALDKSIQLKMLLWKLYLKLLQLAADIYNTGIILPVVVLCWIGQRISQKTDLPVYIAEDPLRAVRGTGMALKTFRNLKVS